jgi:hypothetical protein
VAIVRRCTAVLVVALVGLGLLSPTSNAAPAADTWQPDAPTNVSGYRADFIDNFKTPLNTSVWGRYHGGVPVGTTSEYRRENATVDTTAQVGDGVLNMNTLNDGTWSSAGLSSGPGFSAAQGKWVIKAKFDRAYGVGYAFLLYPKGGGWPPEIDIAEGTAGGPSIMSTFHYSTANKMDQHWTYGTDMSKWHTYGVIIDGDVITFTIDGRVTSTTTNTATPRVPMWLGMQAGVKDCAKSTGECLSASTPSSSNITIDWVAHYAKV